MPNIKITLKDGTTKTVRFADGFTDADIEEVANTLNAGLKPQQPEYKKMSFKEAWNATPEELNENVKALGRQRLKDRQEWEQNHPVISEIQKAYQPHYRSNLIDMQNQAKYGLITPVGQTFKSGIQKAGQELVPSTNIVTTALTGKPISTGKLLPSIAQGAKQGFIQGGVEGLTGGIADNGLSTQALSQGVQSGIIGGTTGGALPALRLLPEKVFLNSFPGLKEKTVKQLINPKSQALDLDEDAAQQLLMNTTENLQQTYKDILNNKGANIGKAVRNLPSDTGIPINQLKADLNEIYDKYSISGDKSFNKAYKEAGDVYDEMQNILDRGKIPQAQIDKENFADFYNKMLRGEVKPTQQAKILSQTPEIWLQQGIPNKEIVTSQNILKKMGSEPNIYDKNHNISAETIQKLPDLLFDPEYILKSNTQNGRYVGVLNATDNQGKPILGILNPQGDVNFMPSAYGRNNFEKFINDQQKLGNILYNKKGVTPSAPTIGAEQGTPITSISDLPENSNLSATKLYEFLHGGMPKIKWDDVNADTKNQILEQIYGKYSTRLSQLSPELKIANKEYAKVKDFQKNEGLKRIINPKNLKNTESNALDVASTALKNYNSSITKGNTNRNIQDLEKLFINEGYEPFLNKIDDVNAANELLKSPTNGWNVMDIMQKYKDVIARPALLGARKINRLGIPTIVDNANTVTQRVLPPIAATTLPKLYGGVEYNEYR